MVGWISVKVVGPGGAVAVAIPQILDLADAVAEIGIAGGGRAPVVEIGKIIVVLAPLDQPPEGVPHERFAGFVARDQIGQVSAAILELFLGAVGPLAALRQPPSVPGVANDQAIGIFTLQELAELVIAVAFDQLPIDMRRQPVPKTIVGHGPNNAPRHVLGNGTHR